LLLSSDFFDFPPRKFQFFVGFAGVYNYLFLDIPGLKNYLLLLSKYRTFLDIIFLGLIF